MAVSKAQALAVLKYRAKAYDRLSTDVPKGKRDEYNAAAKSLSLSLSKLIQNGVEEYISNHAGGEKIPPSWPPTPGNKLSPEDQRLLDSAGKLTPEARKQLVKFLEILTARAATLDTKGGDEND